MNEARVELRRPPVGDDGLLVGVGVGQCHAQRFPDEVVRRSNGKGGSEVLAGL